MTGRDERPDGSHGNQCRNATYLAFRCSPIVDSIAVHFRRTFANGLATVSAPQRQPGRRGALS